MFGSKSLKEHVRKGKLKMKYKKIKIKKDLKLINYFYKLFQIYFTYFNFLILKLNNFKIYKFLINFNYI